jgi:hypothetical protein
MTFLFTDADLPTASAASATRSASRWSSTSRPTPTSSLATLGALQREGACRDQVRRRARRSVARRVPDALLKELPREIVVSGIGERPAIVHLRDFGLTSFTTGSGLHRAAPVDGASPRAERKRYDDAETIRANFLPLEDARDAISPIRVLHDAVTLSGVADCGPMLPLLTGLTPDERARVAPVARELLTRDRARAASPVAA